jgi:hypothetical protein
VKVFPAPLPARLLAACLSHLLAQHRASLYQTRRIVTPTPHKEDLGELGETECVRLVLHLRTNERTVNRGLQAVHFASVSPQG